MEVSPLCYIYHSDLRMTKPKTRLCPSCRAPNLLRRKTCASCVCPLQQSGKDLQSWAKSVKANKNAHRTLESAHVSVTKLNALGYCPLLFVGRHGRKGQINGDMVHHIPVNDEVWKLAFNPSQPSLPLVKECRKHRTQKVFLYDTILRKRVANGRAEVKVRWQSCTK
ncbi:unnamed protein product, partial [Arctogadus glacialis]